MNKGFSQIKKGCNKDMFWFNNTKIQRHWMSDTSIQFSWPHPSSHHSLVTSNQFVCQKSPRISVPSIRANVSGHLSSIQKTQ